MVKNNQQTTKGPIVSKEFQRNSKVQKEKAGSNKVENKIAKNTYKKKQNSPDMEIFKYITKYQDKVFISGRCHLNDIIKFIR